MKKKEILKLMANWDFQDSILPDFGFDHETIDQDGMKGWQLILGFVTEKQKFERLDNYVEARTLLIAEINFVQKKAERLRLKHAKKNELNSPVKKEAPVQNEMQKDLD